LLPGPTAPSEGFVGVRDLDCRTRRSRNPSSILTHQLRRRFPPQRSEDPVPCSVRLPKEPRPPIPLRLARRLPRPRCSAALLGLGPFHAALSPWGGNCPRTRTHQLFRRLLPTGPEIRSPRHRPEGQFSFEPHSIACRRRSVLPSLAAPSCRCRPSGEAGTSVPITIGTWTTNPSRAKRNLRLQACG
jgi:hypothetical protein